MQGFKGVDYSTAGSRGSGPVQFERDAAEADPFGLDQYLTDVRGKKNALDGIGGGGQNSAPSYIPSETSTCHACMQFLVCQVFLVFEIRAVLVCASAAGLNCVVLGDAGRMAASGGGGGKYEEYAGGSSRSKVDFSKGRH